MRDYILNFYNIHPEHHQGILIFTNNHKKAKSIAQWYLREYDIISAVVSSRRIYIELVDGRKIEWVKVSDNMRGYRCSEAYIDREVSDEVYNKLIMPVCSFCSPETIRII